MSVSANVVRIQDLNNHQKQKMFELFAEYYEGISWETFLNDLHEKNDVILLTQKKDSAICGFSTLMWKQMSVEGNDVIAVYSGDTVLKKEYWGSSALGRKFLSYLFAIRFKNPTKKVYWMLISKGYKTYLLMARNFSNHYPQRNKPTPHFEQMLMNEFYKNKFGKIYDAQRGLIVPNSDHSCRVKEAVAPLTSEIRETSPEARFFEAHNPEWQKGVELACLAEMTLAMPTKYFVKKMYRAQSSRHAFHVV